MTYIAAGCVAVTLAILLFVGLIAVRNPVMFKMGLRNIPRRKAQTALIVVGLMLSTVIMTAAFGTGDTLTASVTSAVYDTLGEADEFIEWDTKKSPAPVERQVIPLETVDIWRRQYLGDKDIEAFVPFLSEQLPLQNADTKLNEASARVVAFRGVDAQALGGLKDTSGKPVELSGNDIAVNVELADKIDARVGNRILAFYKGSAVELTVKAIVPNEVLGGAFNTDQKQGAAVDFEFLSSLTKKGQNADGVIVSNSGGVRSGLDHADAAEAKLNAALADTNYKVNALKSDNIKFAELFGNVFTTFFIVLGLFSIAAGILLIFLIFVMLAAERKPEMGMARAVGAKRRQLVESFLAEGMGYDLGSAVVGMIVGVGVTYAMIGILGSAIGDFGLDLKVNFTPRSLVVSFCLGVISTFLVVFISSWRASRLNITSAIRDLPESKPLNPEAATWRGYFRAVLNGTVVMALPIGLSLFLLGPVGIFLGVPLLVIGLVSPWVYFLRGSDFATTRDHRTGEPVARWPLWLGGVLAGTGVLLVAGGGVGGSVGVAIAGGVLLASGAVVLAGFGAAVLLVRVTRDRKPTNVQGWLLPAGIAAPPLGFVLVLLQDTRAHVSWAAGTGTALAIIGVISTRQGLQSDAMFFFAGGISLVFFWAAVSLRYFHLAERVSFTVVSASLLLLWYLVPGKKLEWLVGPLDGNIEMFFLSGVVMVTAGVFIVVYNADILLPAVAALGSRFGRILPAMKTGVAYPLTSRFRTGMTMAMIGLIMFALVVNATLNSNFAQMFLNSDTKGGWDERVLVNRNNTVDDLKAALVANGVDPSPITAIGEVRIANPFEAEVQNLDAKKDSDGIVQPFSHYTVFGADAGFMASNRIPFKVYARGYTTEREVWDALAKSPNLAVLNASATVAGGGFGPPEAADLLHLNPLKEGFEPFTLQLRDPGSGKTTTVTVIGQMKEAADTFWRGMLVRNDTLVTAFPDSKDQAFYVSLRPGTDAADYAKRIESGLVQASADSLQRLLDDQQQLQNSFLLVFQGFMGLGLIVGIAALGVVASRAVVERRQQIGMLRAIGYQRSMVALSFLFESGFIATSGILLGLSLGVSLSWVLFTSGSVGGDSSQTTNAAFTVPWLQILLVSGIAFVASMVMTYLPARAASRVAVAEALRYE